MLPIHDFKSMTGFAKRCQAQVPDWLHEKFARVEGKTEEARKLARELLVRQVEDLAANGVEHFHFYTLNKTGITSEACAALGYRAQAA
jgi:methylenetetrahydrofolate reductase (NADPH)